MGVALGSVLNRYNKYLEEVSAALLESDGTISVSAVMNQVVQQLKRGKSCRIPSAALEMSLMKPRWNS